MPSRNRHSPASMVMPLIVAFKMSCHNVSTGNGYSFGGEYLGLVPNERLKYTDTFDDPDMPGEMTVTVSLKPVSCGTELNIMRVPAFADR